MGEGEPKVKVEGADGKKEAAVAEKASNAGQERIQGANTGP